MRGHYWGPMSAFQVGGWWGWGLKIDSRSKHGPGGPLNEGALIGEGWTR